MAASCDGQIKKEEVRGQRQQWPLVTVKIKKGGGKRQWSTAASCNGRIKKEEARGQREQWPFLPLCCFGRYFFGEKILLINDNSTNGSCHSSLYQLQKIAGTLPDKLRP